MNLMKILFEFLIFEDKIEYIKNKFNLSDSDMAIIKKVNVPNKYLLWLSTQYRKNKRTFKEDISRYTIALNTFDKFKNKIPEKDINTYESLQTLERVTDTLSNDMSNREKVKSIKTNEAEKFYEDSTWLIIKPKTFNASCKYGSNTKWCTTGDEDTFNEYMDDGNLYILINRKTNKKYQYHPSSDQFMDETDTPVFYRDIGLSKELDHKMYMDNDITILKKYGLKENSDGTYDCNYFEYRDMPAVSLVSWIDNDDTQVVFKIKFRRCVKYFDMSDASFVSLKGCPSEIGGSFDCSENSLENLDYFPSKVGGDINISSNNLISFKGLPSIIYGDFDCVMNDFKTLEGFPKEIRGDLRIDSHLIDKVKTICNIHGKIENREYSN